MAIEKVFVLGAGTMGHGIAQVCSQTGLSVDLCDVSTALIDKARKKKRRDARFSLSSFVGDWPQERTEETSILLEHLSHGLEKLAIEDRLYVPVHRPDLPHPHRVSVTLPVINAAKHVLVMAADEEKAPAVAKALAGNSSIPAGRLAPTDGDLTWVLTAAAASGALKPGT